jgi:hypothetical protein
VVSSSSVDFVLTKQPVGLTTQQTVEALQRLANKLGAPFRLLPQKNSELIFSFTIQGARRGLNFALTFAENFSVIVSRISS